MSWKEIAQKWIEQLDMMKNLLDDDIAEIEEAIEANDEVSFSAIVQAYEDK